jgi:hypothetical protein
VVEVVAGTVPYSVRLATTRTPAGEDEAVLQPGETVVLRSADVAHGETIDGRLEYAARDGSGVAFADELEEYSFTRPTREDCDAIAAPATPEPEAPTTSPAPSSTGTPSGSTGPGETSAPGSASTSPPPIDESRPSGSVAPAPADRSSEPPTRQVEAGQTLSLQVGGFLPGETVTIQLGDGGAVLGTAVAGADGTVQTEIRIPGRTAAGRTTVNLVGNDSAVVADVELQVAGAGRTVAGNGWTDLVPLTAAAVALVGSVAGLVSVVGRQRSGGRRHTVIGSA